VGIVPPRVLAFRNNCAADIIVQGKRMTVQDISPISSVQPVSPVRDTVADDSRRVQLMEEMLRDRGYTRNQHGFLVAPGSRMTATNVKSESITAETGSDDEDAAAAA